MQSPPIDKQRKTVLIDRTFQLRFIGRLGGLLFFYLLLFLVISVVAPVAFTFLGDPPEWALMETAFRVEVLLRLILAPLVCTFLCLFAHGVLETFRIAGPNFRFKVVMRDLAKMRLPRGLKIRKGDLLQDTAAEFDVALVALHDRMASLQSEAAIAAAKVREALAAEPRPAAAAAVAAIESLEKSLGRFELCGAAPRCEPLLPGALAVEPLPVAEATTAG